MPGLGKTTIAMLLGAEMGAAKTHVLSGPTLERGKDVVGTLTQLARGDILFIDEVHRMSSHAEEYLYSAREDFRVDLIIDSGADSRSIKVDLKPFTLVAATTREGRPWRHLTMGWAKHPRHTRATPRRHVIEQGR